ncbi:MAG: hypothetical protein QXV35_05720 [Archaeoglobaceae archaeon]
MRLKINLQNNKGYKWEKYGSAFGKGFYFSISEIEPLWGFL